MRLSARVLFVLQNFFHSLCKGSLAVLFLLLLSFFIAAPATAQTSSSNIDPNVPRNQHTQAQIVFMESTSVIICQLIGVDILNDDKGCLGINPITKKIGYEQSDSQKVGGLIGMSTDMITSLYRPVTSSDVYLKDLASNFGIVKHTYAYESPKNGWEGLRPLLEIWKAVRNVAYFVLIIAFIIIGLAVMLRVKIDPRTVMTVQNQIPRIIVSILLITFSYAIVAAMIDFMWISTFVGINVLTSADGEKTNPIINISRDGQHETKLSEKATQTILQTPITYFNQLFRTEHDQKDNPATQNTSNDSLCDADMGLCVITEKASFAVGGIVRDVIEHLFLSPDEGKDCKSWTGVLSLFTPGKDGPGLMGCIGAAVAGVIGWFTAVLMLIIIFVMLLLTLFRVWWMLLKAFIFVMVYTVIAPVWIVMGLLPQKPLGFEKWIRAIFVNLAVFPATAFLFVFARIFMQMYNSTGDAAQQFTPPLVGNPNMTDFGTVIAFGIVLMSPTVLQALQDSMKVGENKYGKNIPATFNQARGNVGAGAKRVWGSWTRKDSQDHPSGPVSRVREQLTTGALSRGLGIPAVGRFAQRKLEQRQNEHEQLGHFSEGQLDKDYNREKKFAAKLRPGEEFPDKETWKERRRLRNPAYAGSGRKREEPKNLPPQAGSAGADTARAGGSEQRERRAEIPTGERHNEGRALNTQHLSVNAREVTLNTPETRRENGREAIDTALQGGTEGIKHSTIKDNTEKIAGIDRDFLAGGTLQNRNETRAHPSLTGADARSLQFEDPEEYRGAMERLEPDEAKREKIMKHDISQFTKAQDLGLNPKLQVQLGREKDTIGYKTSVPVDLASAQGDENTIRANYRKVLEAPTERTWEDNHALSREQTSEREEPEIHFVRHDIKAPTEGGDSDGSTGSGGGLPSGSSGAVTRAAPAEAARTRNFVMTSPAEPGHHGNPPTRFDPLMNPGTMVTRTFHAPVTPLSSLAQLPTEEAAESESEDSGEAPETEHDTTSSRETASETTSETTSERTPASTTSIPTPHPQKPIVFTTSTTGVRPPESQPTTATTPEKVQPPRPTYILSRLQENNEPHPEATRLPSTKKF